MKPNILICGFTGAGKTSLIQAICGEELVPERLIGHGKPKTMSIDEFEGENVCLWDSRGFEPGDPIERFVATLEKFIRKRRMKSGMDAHVHAIWYCVQGAGGRVTDFDLEAIEALSEMVPHAYVLLTKGDITSSKQCDSMVKALKKSGVAEQKILQVAQSDCESIVRLVRCTQDDLPDYEQFLEVTRLEEAAERFRQKKEKLEEQAEEVVQWAAGRALGIALVPIPFGAAAALCANEAYMLNELAEIYEIDGKEQAIATIVNVSAAALGGMALAALVPFMAVGIAPAVTYAVGQAAKEWFASGMTGTEDDLSEKILQAKKKAKNKKFKALHEDRRKAA
jgi:uncharacterized protein (DUF697 family)/ethanolamine utilization protein EutP (predicted NTPase)